MKKVQYFYIHNDQYDKRRLDEIILSSWDNFHPDWHKAMHSPTSSFWTAATIGEIVNSTPVYFSSEFLKEFIELLD
mgnify:FL=1